MSGFFSVNEVIYIFLFLLAHKLVFIYYCQLYMLCLVLEIAACMYNLLIDYSLRMSSKFPFL